MITVEPVELNFAPDVNMLYFEISVDDDFDFENETDDIEITFTASGTDMEAFQAPNTITLDLDDFNEEEEVSEVDSA